MSLSKNAFNTLIAGAFAMSMTGALADNAHAQDGDKEKCYGVVEAGKNMCGDANGKHSCMSQATTSGDGSEWIALPAGVCDKLVGGSTEPLDGFGDKQAHAELGDDGKAE